MTDSDKTKEDKLPWINPDLTFKGAVQGLLALLVVLIVPIVVVGLVAWFAWEFVQVLIHDQTVHVLLGLAIILGIIGALKSQMKKSEGPPV